VLPLPLAQVTTFGRAVECTFSFDDDSLSREHANVMSAGGEYYLKDTSTNGTFVNDVRIDKVTPLKDGARSSTKRKRPRSVASTKRRCWTG
jgi:pSer/pThr/pTyr-binding forkhead associated (FHA) protein